MSATLVGGARDIAHYLQQVGAPEGTGVVALTVAELRAHGLQIERAVDPDGKDPDHVHVIGAKKKSLKAKLAKAARWVARPTPSR